MAMASGNGDGDMEGLDKRKRNGDTSKDMDQVLASIQKLTFEDKNTNQCRESEGIQDVDVPVTSQVTETNYPSIVFDLETTGLARNSHITQIAAVGPRGNFSTYVLPKVLIEKGASKVTGLTCKDGILYHNDQKVETIGIKQAMNEFMAFLGEQRVLFVGHNVKSFDAPVLLNAARNSGLDKALEDKIAGFCDTLLMFRSNYKGLKSYKQESIYQHFFPGESYNAHDAIGDVKALKRIVDKVCPSADVKKEFTYSVKDIRV